MERRTEREKELKAERKKKEEKRVMAICQTSRYPETECIGEIDCSDWERGAYLYATKLERENEKMCGLVVLGIIE